MKFCFFHGQIRYDDFTFTVIVPVIPGKRFSPKFSQNIEAVVMLVKNFMYVGETSVTNIRTANIDNVLHGQSSQNNRTSNRGRPWENFGVYTSSFSRRENRRVSVGFLMSVITPSKYNKLQGLNHCQTP